MASTPLVTQSVDRLRVRRLSVRVAFALLLVTTVAFAAVQLVPSRKGNGEKLLPPLPPPVEQTQDSGDTPELRDIFRVDGRARNGIWLSLLDRKPNPHLSFGFGAHLCLGAPHARLIIRSLLQSLCERVERVDIRDAKRNVEHEDKFVRPNGFESLHIQLQPRS